MKHYIGIDPGKTGAAVCLEGRIITGFTVMPIAGKEFDPIAFDSWLQQVDRDAHGGAHIVLEKVMGRGNWGATQIFNFGKIAGQIEAVVQLSGIPYTLVTPVKWMKVLHEGISPDLDPKARSLIAAKRLFPGENFLKSDRSKNPHDGVVDAALLAEYGRRKNL